MDNTLVHLEMTERYMHNKNPDILLAAFCPVCKIKEKSLSTICKKIREKFPKRK